MSPRARATKPSTSNISPSKSKKNRSLEQTSSTLVPTRQKRLSSLTASTLLQYCTSILSPSRKPRSTAKKPVEEKTSRKRRISNVSEKQIESHPPIRTRREASSRASAMIMQQNEIERSRYNYSIANEHSNTSTTPKARPKPTIAIKEETSPPKTFEFTVPSVPPVTCKYPSLTEALLVEHNRTQETLTNKQDNLLKWTQELASYGRFSPPYADHDIPPECPQEPIPSISPVNNSSSSSEQTLARAPIPAPTFLFPSNGYSLDLRSFYPILPYWQYPIWPFQSPIDSKKSFKLDSIARLDKEKSKPLTFHLHTHHHIHTSSPDKSTVLANRNQSRSPLRVDNDLKKEIQPMSPSIENDVLNLSIHHPNNNNGASKSSRRRKSSPVKRHNPVPSPSTVEKPIGASNASLRRVLKRRTVSATVLSTPSRTTRGKRTTSATVRKRSYSPTSISLPLSKTQARKKQKIRHHWILFGKSEQKLVSIDTDQPPVFRQCYSSIQHITEKDVIKSNDCVILRSEPGSTTPYLAKVKWFWEEPSTGEIQMSIIWYYHPEHTELPVSIRERFLPNELLASRYWDCVSAACIEDKCYVLNFNEYNRYCLREKSSNLFDHSDAVGQLKILLNKNTPTVHHRALPAKNVGHQNIFFCRYVYDYRVNRILKNPSLVSTVSSM